MKILELFAGSRSVGKVAERRGHQVLSSDLEPFKDIALVGDVRKLNCFELAEFEPDMVWASPPCTFFSVASIGHHWNPDHTPKSENALVGVEIVEATSFIIRFLKRLNPDLIYYIENPRGKLRKLDCIQWTQQRDTVTYCQYGDTRMKPTDIWHNNVLWKPRPICRNGDPCHEPAPRGSRTGTQGIDGAYDRSRIPEELCEEIIEAAERRLK